MSEKYSEQELKELSEEFNLLGLEEIDKSEIYKHDRLIIDVDIDTEVDYTKLVNSNFALKKLTKRQDYFFIKLDGYNKETGRLTFEISCPVSEHVLDYYSNAGDIDKWQQHITGTTFPDLCWYHSEGTTNQTLDEVNTKFRSDDDVAKGDLTWFAPSRMVDNFIEIMHTLNQSFLQGLMLDAICYGIYVDPKCSEE